VHPSMTPSAPRSTTLSMIFPVRSARLLADNVADELVVDDVVDHVPSAAVGTMTVSPWLAMRSPYKGSSMVKRVPRSATVLMPAEQIASAVTSVRQGRSRGRPDPRAAVSSTRRRRHVGLAGAHRALGGRQPMTFRTRVNSGSARLARRGRAGRFTCEDSEKNQRDAGSDDNDPARCECTLEV
jgi:hypothetical protein